MRKIESTASSEDLKKQMDALTTITDALREKTADASTGWKRSSGKQKKGNRLKRISQCQISKFLPEGVR